MNSRHLRRHVLLRGLSLVATAAGARFADGQQIPPPGTNPDRRWYDAALAMKRLAESWGDQPYGAVLVVGGRLVGEGPSRVVKRGDPLAHAEREAIRDAQRRLDTRWLGGSVLYSTSRPCAVCEAAAAEAGVSRMYFGEALHDAGPPRS
jgi:tRNA(adenine34) deaminase